MPKRRRYSLRKRHFLNPSPSNYNSYVSVICESSDNGNFDQGENFVVIADCHRIVELEFFMGHPESRRNSLHKIDKLLETLTAFREALHKENELIVKAKGQKKR